MRVSTWYEARFYRTAVFIRSILLTKTCTVRHPPNDSYKHADAGVPIDSDTCNTYMYTYACDFWYLFAPISSYGQC